MALARYEGVAVNLAGDVIPNATVEVRRDQPGRPVVPLFSDREGTIALGNPITTDSEGKFGFHVPGGVYYIRVFTGPSQQPLQQYVRRYQAIGTAAERDVEELASALEAGTATFPTLAELQAFVPEVEGVGGKVSTGEDAGFYHYDTVEEEWVFDRPLYDTLAVVDVDGTAPNSQTGVVNAMINPAGVVEFIAYPTVANTGPMTLSHDDETPKPVLNYAGNPMSSGEWATFVRYRDDGLGNYRLTFDANAAAVASAAATVASTKADEAEASAAEAAGYAAGINLPAIAPGDAGKQLFVNEDEDGYELAFVPPPNVTFEGVQSYWIGSNLELAEIAPDYLFIGMEQGNGLFDGFNTSDGVDVAGATDLDDTVVGEIGAVLQQATSWSPAALDADLTGFTNLNLRVRIAASQISTSGPKVRLRLRGVSSGTTLLISEMYIGHKAASGDVYDFESAPAQITVGASGSFSLAAGANTLSDWITFALDETKDVIISIHTTSGDVRAFTGATANYDFWSKAGASEASTVNVTGYTESGTYDYGVVDRIEAEIGRGDLAARSVAFTLPEAPDWGRLRAIITENDATLNTDIVFSLSRDGADTLPLTMTELFSRPDGSIVVDSGIVDLSGIDSGTSPRWHVATDNGKNPRIKALASVFGVDD